MLEDKAGAIFLAKNQQVGNQTKHFNIWYHFLRDLVEMEKIIVKHLNTESNEANICTKNVVKKIFNHHCDNIRTGRLNLYEVYKVYILETCREDVRM